jgi:hypothetical protein
VLIFKPALAFETASRKKTQSKTKVTPWYSRSNLPEVCASVAVTPESVTVPREETLTF